MTHKTQSLNFEIVNYDLYHVQSSQVTNNPIRDSYSYCAAAAAKSLQSCRLCATP